MKVIKTFEQYKAETKDFNDFKTDVTPQENNAEAAQTFNAEEMNGLSTVGNKVELPKSDKED